MKNVIKKEILTMLAKNLEVFYPELKNHYMCPICLKKIPLNEKNRISEAHIIPKAAGGRLKTYLCTSCNSHFGREQDKWFGELIRISCSENPSIFATYIKEGYFMIDGIRVNGQWKRDKNGNFEFCIYKNRNSPETNRLLNEKFGTRPEEIKLSFPIPIIRNERLIDIGFLTAGYLMWFGTFGYSWVLQQHLQPIRDQILNPNKEIVSAKYVFHIKSVDWKPWVGVMAIDGDMVPVFAFKRYAVVFPPRDRPNFYKNLGVFSRNVNASDLHPISFSKKPSYGPAIVLLFENRIIIAPDHVPTSKDSVLAIHFSSKSLQPSILKPVTEHEFQRLKEEKGAIVIKAKVEE